MATKPEAASAAAAEKPKSKKMLFIIIGVVVLALGGGAAAFFMLKKHPEEGGEAAAKTAHAPAPRKAPDPKAPPTYLPLESMVVNLADAGGSRFAQLGITLKVEDSKTADNVKLFMPSVRNAVLLLVSQRSADELLAVEGKEKLSRAIIREVSLQLGYDVGDDDEEDDGKSSKRKRRAPAYTPVQEVLFSSFIIQ